MSIKNIYWVELYLHNQHQLWVPNVNQGFGSTKKFYNALDNRGHNQQQTVLQIGKMEEQSIDKPTERCNMSAAAKGESPRLAECITSYIEKKTKCRSKDMRIILFTDKAKSSP